MLICFTKLTQNTNIKQNIMNIDLEQKQPRHILYSSGQLINSSEVDPEVALTKLADTTRRSCSQIKERLLNGKPKKLKSSSSLKKLLSLQKKLINCGLNVYIVTDSKNC